MDRPARNREKGAVASWLAPAVSLAAALLLRLLYYFSISDFVLFATPTGDSIDYLAFARQIVSGSILGKDTLFHSSPIYPYLLAPLVALHLSPALIALHQLLIGALAAPLIVILARRLGGETAGWIAAGIYLLMPGPLFYDGELLADFLLVAGMVGLVLLAARPEPGRRSAILTVICTSVVVLAKPNLALVAGVLAVSRLWIERRRVMRWTCRWAIPLALTSGILLAVGGTFARNLLVKGEPIPLTTSGGINFWIGNHPGASGAFSVPPDLADRLWQNAKARAVRESGRALTDAEVQDFYYSRGLAFISRDPLGYLGSVIRRVRIFLSTYELPNHQDLNFFSRESRLLRMLPLGWWLVLPLALAGMVVLRGGLITYVNAAFLSYVLSLVMLFFVTGRYRYPVLGLAIALAAAFVTWLYKNIRRLKAPRIVLLAAIVSVTAALALLPLPPEATSTSSYSYHHLGAAYAARGDFQSAIASYEGALARSPDDAFSMNNLGLIYMRLGRFEPAVRYIRQAAQLEPANPEFWANLAGALFGREDEAGAERAIGRALELDPGHAGALVNLAVLRAKQGDVRQAVDLCRRALARDPELTQAQELLKYLQPGAH